MNFASDNTTGAAPEIMAALAAANEGQAMPYGEDALSERMNARFSEVFETEADVFPVATGTAANALALSVMTPPFGAVYCHSMAHVAVDECGAPAYFTGGAKLVPLDGGDGKIASATFEAALDGAGVGVVHNVQPAAISLTQLTEYGTAYTVREVTALCEVAHGAGLAVHMDGARFANALVSLGCAPADVTWRAGVDVLSFGATKNGAWAAEAIVIFKPELAREMGYRRKRAGHLFSKMRFVTAQLEAYLADGLWLENARHANRMTARLAAGLNGLPGVRLLYPADGNQLFVDMPESVVSGLLADGFSFIRMDADGIDAVRLVTAFNTRPEDVDALAAAAGRHAAGA